MLPGSGRGEYRYCNRLLRIKSFKRPVFINHHSAAAQMQKGVEQVQGSTQLCLKKTTSLVFGQSLFVQLTLTQQDILYKAIPNSFRCTSFLQKLNSQSRSVQGFGGHFNMQAGCSFDSLGSNTKQTPSLVSESN